MMKLTHVWNGQKLLWWTIFRILSKFIWNMTRKFPLSCYRLRIEHGMQKIDKNPFLTSYSSKTIVHRKNLISNDLQIFTCSTQCHFQNSVIIPNKEAMRKNGFWPYMVSAPQQWNIWYNNYIILMHVLDDLWQSK